MRVLVLSDGPSRFHDSRAVTQIGFIGLLLALGLWFAWVSRWGRILLGLVSLWTIIAFIPVGYPNFVDYRYEMVIGRGWASIFSTLTILAVFALVQRLYKRPWMALIAATAFAFSVISIQVSHYCITESLITLMGVVMALAAWEIAEEGSWRAYLVAGAAFGIALANKSSSLYYVVMIVGSHLLWLSRRDAASWRLADKKLSPERRLWQSLGALALLVGCMGAFLAVGWKFQGVFRDLYQLNPATGQMLWILLLVVLIGAGSTLTLWGFKEFKIVRAQVTAWIPMVAVGGLAFFLFCLFSPWSLLDQAGFLGSMNYEWDVVSKADACYVFQFKDTPRYLFHLWNLMQVNLWWPLGVTAVLGMVWVYVRFLMGLRPAQAGQGSLPIPFLPGRSFSFHPADFVLLLWFTAYFGFIGMWNTKFIRYMVPLVPFFCVFAAMLMCDVFEKLRGKGGRVLRALILFVVLGGSLFYSMAYMAVYRYPHPWIDSSVWMFKNIPFGSFILNEEWDDGLPTGVDPTVDPRVDKPLGPQNYHEENVRVYETYGQRTDDNPIKKQDYISDLTKAQYLTISSKKLWYTITNSTPECKPTGFNIFPVSSRYYRLLWTGQLGYKMVGDFHNYPRLLGWSHPDDMAEESFSVYDHPRCYVFKKVETVSPERMMALLSSDDYVKGVNREMMRAVTPENVDAFIEAQKKRLESSGVLSTLDAQMAASVTPTPVPDSSKASRKDRSKEMSQALLSESVPPPAPPTAVKAPPGVPGLPSAASLRALDALAKNPVIEGDIPNETVFPKETWMYQLRAWMSWWLLLVTLGLLALPFALRLMPGLLPGAYSLSKMMGLLAFSWVVWFSGNFGFKFTAIHCWVWLLLCAAGSLTAAYCWRGDLREAYRKHGTSWWIQEGIFLLAFGAFTLVRMHNPHIHDPIGEGYSGGGEAGMDFGFLSSVVRGETFPAQNMWMAGEPIGYSFYYGHLMMGVLTKALFLAPEVTYNLAIATLFSLIFTGVFGIAYGLCGVLWGGLAGGFLCAVAGNLAGAFQALRYLCESIRHLNFAPHVFDYWGPSRVIPNSINEFPYFSVLFADLHAHTLAMPFAMLFIALVASVFFSPVSPAFHFKKQPMPILLTAVLGFVFGALGFLNTWELPVWAVLFMLVLSVRSFPSLKEKTLLQGFQRMLLVFAVGLFLLQVFTWLLHYGGNQTLGGRTIFLACFFALSLLTALGWLWLKKDTQPFALRVVEIGSYLFLLLGVAFATWFPYFTGFAPQQSEVLWVTPTLRTSLPNFWTIYAAFISVIGLGFLTAYPKEVLGWLSKKPLRLKKRGDVLNRLLDSAMDGLERFRSMIVKPKGVMASVLVLGLGIWALVVGASWVHFAAFNMTLLASLLAAITLSLLIAAWVLKDSTPVWIAFVGFVFLWAFLMFAQVIPLRDSSSPLMGLLLFTALWFAAFFHIGLAIRVKSDSKLSFTFLLGALFFFVTAGLEVFVMKEYLGGEWMRNNSLFKFGICAWTLGSITAGALLPKLFHFLAAWGKARRESLKARNVLVGAAWLFSFLIFVTLFWEADTLLENSIVLVLNLLLGLGLWLGWLKRETWTKPTAAVIGIPWGIVLLLPLVAPFFPGGLLGLLARKASDFGFSFLLPFQLSGVLLLGLLYFWEKRADLGRRLAGGTWKILLLLLLALISVYPVAGSWRKCHGFWPSIRANWIGYSETPTLNGLSFIRRNNRYDAAAIRFLNDRVSGQPCLIEAVGLGYNSWGSRYSIFTGIPALMGWDGHVSEWVGATESERIRLRRAATEEIFNTPDRERAKSLLDAYGVRLVVVGPLEKGMLDPQKRYAAEGLSKFDGWLPLVYKNPGVSIYYNSPSGAAVPSGT